jgi:cytochrome c oxidase assembly protein subunit 11
MDEKQSQHRNLTLRLLLMTGTMFAFGFALVPLYDVFCEITGIRTPIVAADASQIKESPAIDRDITIEFLANRGNSAPWEFKPAQAKMTIQPGKFYDVTYFARNLTNEYIVGLATPDVKPAEAGKYLKKVECFCFNEQAFEAGEAKDMPIRFLVDPDIPQHVDTITLSYTFFARPEKAANN